MTRSVLPFVPSIELAQLLAGSFQDTTARITSALRTEASNLFAGQSAQLLGVFPSFVVALVGEAELVRVKYALSESGEVYFTGTSDIDLTVVTEKNLHRFIRQEARAAADLFLRGLVDQANEKIVALAPLVDQASSVTDEDILKSFAESREGLLWKTTLSERADKVQKFLGEDKLPAPLSAKFKRLYDGSTAKAEMDTFKALVQDDVAHLISRLSAVEASTTSALHAIRLVRERAIQEGGEEAITSLEAFASDLLSDVTQVREFVVEAVAEFGSVDRIAKVFDSVASEVTSFEVAGAFVAKTVARLT
jgi:hypothetical protein